MHGGGRSSRRDSKLEIVAGGVRAPSVSRKKNSSQEVGAEVPVVKALRPIRLTPSSTDYATAAELTARVLKLTGPAALKRKPSKRLLALANWDA